MTVELLDFYGPTLNSMDGVSDRDYLIEFLSACATIMMHLSRFSEEVIIWNSNEYQFVEIDDAYSTGSSIMPQKKNPDIAELIRGKTGRVYGALISILTTMKGLPLAYNKDMQEDKELTFDAIDTVKGCILLFTGMMKTIQFKKDVMEVSAMKGFTNATDAADYLVKHGVPFRDAHGIIGQLVLYCIEKDKAIDELSLDELKAISPVFEADIYEDNRAGHDNSELLQIREFKAGDRLQNIHWKMSAKQDELMVKENSMPKSCPVVLFLDFQDKKECRKNMLSFIEIAASISFSLIDAGCIHYVAWYSDADMDVTRVRIDGEASLYYFIELAMKNKWVASKEDISVRYGEKYSMEPYIWKLTLDEELVLKKQDEVIKKYAIKDLEKEISSTEILL